MKRIRTVGLALGVVFALSAVAATTAFGAESEFLAKGGVNPAGIKIEGKGGLAFFESAGGNKVECEKSESLGEFKDELEARITLLEYSGNCKLTGTLNSTCPSISLKELNVLPGTEVGSETVRLLEFLPRIEPTLTEFTCGSTKIKVVGGVICRNNQPALGVTGEVICKELTKLGDQEFKKAIVNGKEATDSLEAEATAGIFKLKEEDAQNTTEELKYVGGEVEQTT
jgi:hypothetical protein